MPWSSLSTISYSESLMSYIEYEHVEYEHSVKARLEHGI